MHTNEIQRVLVGIRRSMATPLLALGGALITCSPSSGEPWDRFLKDPDVKSYAELSQNIDASRCGWGKEANEDVVPDRVRGPLFNLIGSGNGSAFSIGLVTMRCFDGGDLEDLYQSSGRFMEQHPRDFLAKVTERKVASSDLVLMAASVPANDDVEAALGIIAKRIQLLRGLNDEDFAHARSESIRALEEHLQLLRQLKENLEPGQ